MSQEELTEAKLLPPIGIYVEIWECKRLKCAAMLGGFTQFIAVELVLKLVQVFALAAGRLPIYERSKHNRARNPRKNSHWLFSP